MIEGAEYIVKWKKKLKSLTPHVVFQFLVVKPNEHQIPEARAGQRIGVDDLWLKTAQIYAPTDDHALIPDTGQVRRYKRDANGVWRLKNKQNSLLEDVAQLRGRAGWTCGTLLLPTRTRTTCWATCARTASANSGTVMPTTISAAHCSAHAAASRCAGIASGQPGVGMTRTRHAHDVLLLGVDQCVDLLVEGTGQLLDLRFEALRGILPAGPLSWRP